ncbi:5,6-dimethylbenzimidazole synthase [Roseibium sp. RKSG952]|uniref:5,6-dimethylbenzimidazole synthase n=1 Tax=Roseibium sp. RKSG952 TaxID=2529384 RepID=UPI0012BBD3A7|nr:5,6-dimethylbenzimidazole synthase [Roseibium sp. RKSG952]MTH98399.1 5,6-dimethylbenzimidazole synthase [Roseibium sp. RKSG952]
MSNSRDTDHSATDRDTDAGVNRPPVFDRAFADKFHELLLWRRDVRRFVTRPLEPGLLSKILDQADLAPSVGNSQPWRIVRVMSPERRATVRSTFEQENSEAMAGFDGERRALYARLKLAGLDDAPEHLAVFCDNATAQGHGLGKATMPETLAYSVVGMIQTLWLAARMRGVGVGWVSILDPVRIHEALSVSEDWQFIAYLCLGYPEEDHVDPELERAGWQGRTPLASRLYER